MAYLKRSLLFGHLPYDNSAERRTARREGQGRLVEPFSALMTDPSWANVGVDPALVRGGTPETLELLLAIAAHEIRGPLLAAKAAIEAYIAMDARRDSMSAGAASGDHDRLLHSSVDQLTQLSTTVGSLLLATTPGALSLRLVETDLVQVARDSITSTTSSVGPARVVLWGPERLVIPGSPLHLASALSNLLRNALDYSPPGTPVLVTVGQLDRTAILTVEDQGAGIPPAEREVIFAPLTRGSAGSRARSGSGLGLYIARRCVEAHGGQITLEWPAEGTVFRIELPVKTEE